MPKRMLIDATHPEETRVVVVNGTRLEEFDFESSTKRQVKGNIYLAKVTRVEPSLQAAFIDYGGNRHGFLAFSEVHPDYYRIPVSDRPQGTYSQESSDDYGDHARDNGAGSEDTGVPLASALPEPVQVPQSEAEDEFEGDESDGEPLEESSLSGEAAFRERVRPDAPSWQDAPARAASPFDPVTESGASAADWPPAEKSTPTGRHGAADADSAITAAPEPADEPVATDRTRSDEAGGADREPATVALRAAEESAVAAEVPEADVSQTAGETRVWHDRPGEGVAWDREPATIALRAAEESVVAAEIPEADVARTAGESWQQYDEPPYEPRAEFTARSDDGQAAEFDDSDGADGETVPDSVETLGGDEVEEVEEADAAERRRRHPMRHYKIQEVIKRRQIMLVQVAKEERGNKGAALTTYLSLAGRYCVLMPNTNRGGGVSRKITSLADRRRLKDILEELDIPEGMGVIVRTAGAERSKAEIKRDYEYLLRLWNEIRDLTLRSTAPALIYEEGNLIKRSIRDLYTRDLEEVLVEGEEGYRTAKAFMRTLMPSHAKRVQPYRDQQIGLFHRFQVESQIDAIHSPIAQLRSGGYLVINQTEALVAIDVNSGRSTRERNIEETALRTNLEAADEIARQLRLRDLAGLIVIDFIDMEEHRNQIAVERRLKEALKNDRARIQVGRISPFGLLEMSRQRLRPSLTETSTQPCPHCGGTGFIRSVESTALHVLRSIEEEGIRRRSAEICIYVPTTVALYILNQKRDSLNQIEARYTLRVMVARDDSLVPPAFRLERLRPYGIGEAPPVRPIQAPTLLEYEDEEESEEAEAELEATADVRGGGRNRRGRTAPLRPMTSAAAAAAVAAGDAMNRATRATALPPPARRMKRRARRRRAPGTRSTAKRRATATARPSGAGAGAVAAAAVCGPGATTNARTSRPRMPPRPRQRTSPGNREDRNRRRRAPRSIRSRPRPRRSSLDPWSARYGLETASLAPFAGEPLSRGGGTAGAAGRTRTRNRARRGP